MAVEVFVSKMTDFMESAEIISWLVAEGDAVQEHQPILELETDKVAAELEAPATGILKGIRSGAVPGAKIAVGETIAFIAAPDETVPVLPALGAAPTPPPAQAATTREMAAAPPAQPDEIKATPVARRMAIDMGVDLALVTGTGPRGRIVEEDLRRFAAAQRAIEPAQKPVVGLPQDAAVETEWVDLTSIQRLTGRRMVESWQTVPQFSLTVDADMTNALALRDKLSLSSQAETGDRPSITGLLVKIVAVALRAHPWVNSSFVDGKLGIHKHINIGVAVGTDTGLVVPVIRDAPERSFLQIVRELHAMQNKAQTLQFSSKDLEGGTFTISNLGMFGIDEFRGIVNPPQSALLAVGRVRKRLVVLPDDTFALRHMMTLTLSVDHRSMDGVQAARFLQTVREMVENPEGVLLST